MTAQELFTALEIELIKDITGFFKCQKIILNMEKDRRGNLILNSGIHIKCPNTHNNS